MMFILLALLSTVFWAANSLAADEIHTVIRVTPTLAYIDVGSEEAARTGSTFAIVELENDNRYYSQVAKVKLIRLFEDFSIGEILTIEEGAKIEVLQRAMPLADWQSQGAVAASRSAVLPEETKPLPQGQTPKRGRGSRTLYVLGGIGWGKEVKVEEDIVTPRVGPTADRDLGLRVAAGFGRHWRVNLTYRLAGKPLGAAGVEVTQIAFELDLHRVFGRIDRPGFYAGSGVGIHQLDIKQRRLIEKTSTLRPGLNFAFGWQRPTPGWTLTAEAGYLLMSAWEDVIDVGGLRTYVGIGKNF